MRLLMIMFLVALNIGCEIPVAEHEHPIAEHTHKEFDHSHTEAGVVRGGVGDIENADDLHADERREIDIAMVRLFQDALKDKAEKYEDKPFTFYGKLARADKEKLGFTYHIGEGVPNKTLYFVVYHGNTVDLDKFVTGLWLTVTLQIHEIHTNVDQVVQLVEVIGTID